MSGVIEKTKSTSLIPAARLEDARKLSEVSRSYRQELMTQEDPIIRAMVVAHAVKALQQCITPEILADFKSLMNSPLGFKTDRGKDKPPYADDVIRDCVIISLLRGLRPTGNEWNILAGNTYITKEGYTRLLCELQGFSCLRIVIGELKDKPGGCLVDISAFYLWHGTERKMECVGSSAIPIRRNEGMGADAIIGKAESKIRRRIFAELTNSVWDDDADEDDEMVIEGTASEVAK